MASYVTCIAETIHDELDSYIGAGVVGWAVGNIERYTRTDAHRVVWTPVQQEFSAPTRPRYQLTFDGITRNLAVLYDERLRLAADIWTKGESIDDARDQAERLERNLIVAARKSLGTGASEPVNGSWTTDEDNAGGRTTRGKLLRLQLDVRMHVLDEVWPVTGNATTGTLVTIGGTEITSSTISEPE